jgi:hypothetical protein
MATTRCERRSLFPDGADLPLFTAPRPAQQGPILEMYALAQAMPLATTADLRAIGWAHLQAERYIPAAAAYMLAAERYPGPMTALARADLDKLASLRDEALSLAATQALLAAQEA